MSSILSSGMMIGRVVSEGLVKTWSLVSFAELVKPSPTTRDYKSQRARPRGEGHIHRCNDGAVFDDEDQSHPRYDTSINQTTSFCYR
jgi:hypothetical protein